MIQKIEAIPALADNYIYALSDGNGNCAIVDPGDAAPVREYLHRNGLRLKVIVCTHHHADHVAGAVELATEFEADIWTSRFDLPRISGATKGVQEGETLDLWGENVQILDLPGHTLGHMAIHLPRLNAVFVGDTLFSLGCGRLFEGTAKQMFSSLQKIKLLPVTTQIYFGHEYTLRNLQFLRDQGLDNEPLNFYKQECQAKRQRGEPTSPVELRTELALNPFLRAKSTEEFAEWRERRNHF